MKKLLLASALFLAAFSANATDYNLTVLKDGEKFLDAVISTNNLTVECKDLKKEDMLYSGCLTISIAQPYVKSITTDLNSNKNEIELGAFNYGLSIGLKENEENLFVSAYISDLIGVEKFEYSGETIDLPELKTVKFDQTFTGDVEFNLKGLDFKIEKIKK